MAGQLGIEHSLGTTTAERHGTYQSNAARSGTSSKVVGRNRARQRPRRRQSR